MAVASDQIDAFLKTLPFFEGLPEATTKPIFDAGSVHKYSKGEHLFFHGDRAEQFYIVIGGCIKVYSETLEGDESVIWLITQGMNVGEASIFDGAIYPFSACAAENSEVFEAPAEILKNQAKQSPELSSKILSVMSEELQNFQRQKEHMTTMSTDQRVGCLLLRLSANMIGKGGTFTLPYDKSLAAANLGMKPETFSRALKELKQFGVHVNGPEVTINDFSELANHSCAHCSAMPGTCDGDKRECTGKTPHCPRPAVAAE